MELISALLKPIRFEVLFTKIWSSGTAITLYNMYYYVMYFTKLRLTFASLLCFCSTWQKGDIMCIDNFSVSHGRQPTYDLGRKILVAWSEPLDKTSLAPIEEEAIVTKQSGVVFDDKLVPAALAVTPDSSPETTLTGEEAENLRDSFALNMAVQNMARKNSFKDSSESDFAVSSHRRNKSCPVHIDEIFA